MTDINLFETVKEHICQCAYDLSLASYIEAILKMPMREFHFSIPVHNVVDAMIARGWV